MDLSIKKIKGSTNVLKFISYLLFPLLVISFIILYAIDSSLYYQITLEDHFVEWLTFACLAGSGILSLIVTLMIKKRHQYMHWFFLLFFMFNLLAGFEEISWGQRVFQIESSDFFTTYNDQQETNLHNTFQGIVGLKTKHIALLVLFVYGVILPWRWYKGKLHWKIIQNNKFIIPPLFLAPAFIIATFLMIDFPTGNEEEIGELFYSLCFLLMMCYYYQQAGKGYFRSPRATINSSENNRKEL
jgi:hypothetical protein